MRDYSGEDWKTQEDLMRKMMAPWLLVFGLTPGSAALGQQVSNPPLPSSLPEQVADLDRSVKELVALFRQYLDRQQVDYLFKRIELSLQKMGPLNEELRSLRASKAADEGELGQLRTALAGRQALSSQTEAKPGEEQREEALLEVQREAQIKLLRSRISQADQRIAELENELAQEKQNVQRWEAAIDQHLGTR
jgi:chromosome segregation ATPase